MKILNLLKEKGEICIEWNNMTSWSASELCDRLVMALDRNRYALWGFIDNGYLMLHLTDTKPRAGFPLNVGVKCLNASFSYRSRLAQHIDKTALKFFEIAAPRKEEIEALRKILGREPQLAIKLTDNL